jgi:hypothetical protein
MTSSFFVYATHHADQQIRNRSMYPHAIASKFCGTVSVVETGGPNEIS